MTKLSNVSETVKINLYTLIGKGILSEPLTYSFQHIHYLESPLIIHFVIMELSIPDSTSSRGAISNSNDSTRKYGQVSNDMYIYQQSYNTIDLY